MTNAAIAADSAQDGAEPRAWFHIEAAGYMGAQTRLQTQARQLRRARRAAERTKRRPRVRGTISSTLSGAVRHAVMAGLYVGLAYTAKVAFGVSLVFSAMH